MTLTVEPHVDIDKSRVEDVLNGQLDYDECPNCGAEIEHYIEHGSESRWKGKHSVHVGMECTECDVDEYLITTVKVSVGLVIVEK